MPLESRLSTIAAMLCMDGDVCSKCNAAIILREKDAGDGANPTRYVPISLSPSHLSQ